MTNRAKPDFSPDALFYWLREAAASEQDLADALDVSPRTLGRWLDGTRPPRTVVILAICHLLSLWTGKTDSDAIAPVDLTEDPDGTLRSKWIPPHLRHPDASWRT